jgi:hypothetical protein
MHQSNYAIKVAAVETLDSCELSSGAPARSWLLGPMKLKIAISSFLIFSSLSVIAGPETEYRVSFTSYGPAQIGMTVPALEKALGVRVSNSSGESEDECRYVSPAKGFDGIAFMLINNRVARIDIDSSSIRTLSGAHIGDSKKAILAMYQGRVTVSPHAYDGPDGAYLTILSANKKYGLRFETEKDKVTHFHVGRVQEIQYVEGCS